MTYNDQHRDAYRRAAAWASTMTVLVVASAARGQSVGVERPRTFVVGSPPGARSDRVDGARTGLARTALPSSGLRTEWRVPLGTLVEHGPLVDARGNTYVVGTRGEAMAIGRDGVELWRVSTGAPQPGPAALLADDTLVFVDASGEAVAIRDRTVRWHVRVGQAAGVRPAPLPLDDGGVVVATPRELAALDADGHERARTTLPEATTLPLMAALGKVIAITASGAIWSWMPGAAEPSRIGTFGAEVDAGAALADDHTLVAVTADRIRITAVDLLRGTAKTRAFAPAGLWLGPPAMRGSTAYVVLLTPSSELAVAVNANGTEVSRVLLALHPPPVSPDGGSGTPAAAPHTAPLVDASGAFAFATMEGAIGVANARGVDLLPEACEPPLGAAARAAPSVVGLAPLEVGAFVAICHAGALIAIGTR